ncbi:Elongator complex protein 1 [Vanrija pseudolonga]|uniref:Elongator complex protein 1 n=1 Tax=Vanrija pseudolonga TaxID=143232 RepID=A0AAF0YJ51_9TREE|nr:Elongator complex protein 1 [Vanrija pseudolonga]
MRSLAPTTVQVASINLTSAAASAGQLAVDPESGTVYATIEKATEEGLEVDIVRIEGLEEGAEFSEVIGSFTTPVTAPFPLAPDVPQVLDLHFFPDDRSLIVILAGGDIATLQIESIDGGIGPAEVVGSIDSGVKAAAWSPDDEQLVLVTGEDNLVCMTRTFDTIYEGPLRSDEFGEDKFINVGWGSKSTQFHGSLGKAAALAAKAPAPAAPTSFSHTTDDGLPRITFRGDASFFAVSSLDAYGSGVDGARRQVRIYSREASEGFTPKLSATSESIPGLEPALAWRPSGNVIASLVRYGYQGGGEGRRGRWDVAMLERNGLRHGGFELREAEATWEHGRVKNVSWNSDSEVLAVWIQREEEDVVQLWTMNNYHYYLKQEIVPHWKGDRRFTSVKWHPENPMALYLVDKDHVQVRTFVWDTYASRLPMPIDTGSVAVVDGKRLLVTPFRTQNVPPPMSSFQLSLPSQPVHVSVSPSDDSLAVLYASGLVQVWDLNVRLPEAGTSRLRHGGKVAEPKLRWEQSLAPTDGEFIAKRVCLSGTGQVAALFFGDGEGGALLRTADANEVLSTSKMLPCVEHILWEAEAGWLVVEREGVLRSVDESSSILVHLCSSILTVSVSAESRLVFALSQSGKLHAASLGQRDATSLASAVTSFTTTPEFLVYTTSSQSSTYAPLSSVARIVAGEEAVAIKDAEWETRRVERGSLAVVACPSSMSLVLQMPRGNLETIYPRPLVLAVVRQDILSGAYRSAFLTCRKHRLDLNILYDLAPAKFAASIEDFAAQIPEVDYLNLFVSQLNSNDSSLVLYPDLGRDPTRPAVPADKVNSICDSLREILEKKDLVKYVETILTAHVCKVPPDYEAGLNVLLHLQAEHPSIVEESIKYIIFLSNVNRLYDVALGMYNFQLVLMIAQYSQKDPKEYLPFLRELRALETNEQRFRIDDHLGRRESALRNLKAAGPSRFEDAASYLSRYELYDEAFKLYKDDPEHLLVIYDLYGTYLYDRRDFYDAAIAYTFAGKPDRALKAFEKAHAWRELFTLAEKQLDKDGIASLVERVTEYLVSRGRHIEASQIYMEYEGDVDAAVDVLARGAEFAEAYRLSARHSRDELVERVIHPALDDAHEELSEVFQEIEGQLDKEMKRLAFLKKLRLEDPDTFYIVDNEPELENVDVATNATTVATNFTRYTVAPTTAFSQSTRMTGQTAKSKHRPSKKRAAGRKGTVDEYDYLVASLGRLVTRVDEKSAEAVPLLRQLALASADHRTLAHDLQASIVAIRKRLESSLDDAWADRPAILDGVESSGGMGLGGDVGPARALVRPSVGAWVGLGRLV